MSTSVCIPDQELLTPKTGRLKRILKTAASLRVVAFVAALGVVTPMAVILASLVRPETEIWRHIAETLLADLAMNTFLLGLGVLAGTFAIGVSAAWLTAIFDFPGRRFFNWALMLPLAMPTYVLAFVFIGIFDFAGPVQTALRNFHPTQSIRLPDVRSAGGVILVMSLALYPYVYLLARNAFKTMGKSVLEVSQAFGYGRTQAFFKAALPMARPWIASGLMLVLMETLADFGAVSVFNFDTFTTGIYKSWFGFFSLKAAAQLSSLLLLVVFLVVIAEQSMRAKMQFTQVGKTFDSDVRIRLYGWHKWVCTVFLGAVLTSAFIVPSLQLLLWALESFAVEFDTRYLGLMLRSLFFSTLSAIVITAWGLVLAYANRRHTDPATRWTLRLSTMGYAMPGTVLAVGVVIMIGFVDRHLTWGVGFLTGHGIDPIFQNSILVVVFAYMVRFLTVGFNSVSSAMQRITQSLDEASTILGVSGVKLLGKVHVPILKNGLYTAAILVFVDVMKEMPITLMTRPFGWDTLAVKIFELTSEGEWQRAALPSLVLVIVGILPLMWLNRRSEEENGEPS